MVVGRACWPAGSPVGELSVGGLLARVPTFSSSGISITCLVVDGWLVCGGCVVVGNGVVGALKWSSG